MVFSTRRWICHAHLLELSLLRWSSAPESKALIDRGQLHHIGTSHTQVECSFLLEVANCFYFSKQQQTKKYLCNGNLLGPVGVPRADSEDDNSSRVRKFRRVRHAYYLKARTEVPLAVYEGISERIIGRTFALQNNPKFWFRIKDISTIWRPDLGSDAGFGFSGDPGNSQNHAGTSQSRSDVEGASTSQLAACDSTSVLDPTNIYI